jgi:hypothetical protein
MANHATGARFGRWRVISFLGIIRATPQVLSLCQCGNEANVERWDLELAKSKSCGCYRRDVATVRGRTPEHIALLREGFKRKRAAFAQPSP